MNKIVRLHPRDEDAVARELAATYKARYWNDPVRLHQVAGEYATDISLETCLDMIHVRTLLRSEEDMTEVYLALLKLFRSLEKCMDKSVTMAAELRGDSEAMDLSDYVGSPGDAA